MSKKSPGMSELNGYIPKELKLKFKSLCAAQDRSMSEVLVELITNWINEQEEQQELLADDESKK
ncbi:plasmid partition protein ParG [Limnoraphis robusta Tam1]|uniref:plasmid partition protein ParG n=1 Tax=Limnoraphis robusta TaxID=1118279 RepID=UPI002B208ED1|nr:plasmid partition protein ParG [Limnoraphis robusta]MEA5499197.1 plasmid partition protein ParG [Limnoraphis robusta BA-68 BA1]MEA5540682.1 plasmid partition protein ParG [Limnoraphis robusta Tam1]